MCLPEDDHDRRAPGASPAGLSMPEMTPRAFSFNSPHGACTDPFRPADSGHRRQRVQQVALVNDSLYKALAQTLYKAELCLEGSAAGRASHNGAFRCPEASNTGCRLQKRRESWPAQRPRPFPATPEREDPLRAPAAFGVDRRQRQKRLSPSPRAPREPYECPLPMGSRPKEPRRRNLRMSIGSHPGRSPKTAAHPATVLAAQNVRARLLAPRRFQNRSSIPSDVIKPFEPS